MSKRQSKSSVVESVATPAAQPDADTSVKSKVKKSGKQAKAQRKPAEAGKASRAKAGADQPKHKAGKGKQAPKAGKRKQAKGPIVPPASEPGVRVLREVKDRFRMPEDDYALIAELKKRAKKAGRKTAKSELLRAGLRLLNALDPVELLGMLEQLPALDKARS
ncbi:hypothetical protein [Pseudomarimonas arenosa]|uniref:Uncharacterized protein n=1 Tax=Pseudomarimonas arenosa TaxID=2774145 RepID=A0AAW3ZIE8_9GAMM|nr:hypothetical protein [Pseudomarimonas arenosa]MBD8525855.1 hypothetical protein [Pseudomarimonas arenosa]